MEIFKSGDIEIKYRIEGSDGPLVVLLHGFGGGPQDWSDIVTQAGKRVRFLLPNLKVFFSHAEPLTFTQQVNYLVEFLKYAFQKVSAKEIVFAGQSYGATLSVAARIRGEFTVKSHILFNPMPFHPFEIVRDAHIRTFINFGYMPGGMSVYLRSQQGRTSLAEVAKIFRIGGFGHHEIHRINDRKLILVEKALERFRWIDKNEDWLKWKTALSQGNKINVNLLVHSDGDCLFTSQDYQNFAKQISASEVRCVRHDGHLLVQDRVSEVLSALQLPG